MHNNLENWNTKTTIDTLEYGKGMGFHIRFQLAKTMDSVDNIEDIYSTGMYHTGEYICYISDPSINRLIHQ